MKYKVLIDNFEGPLDLLLHLIKQSDISIVDINIEEITKQYLDYINAMENLNLNIASEYLVLAAELIEMKSQILLPNPKKENDEFEEDPRIQLINRLLEYEKYKNKTSVFSKMQEERHMLHTRLPYDMTNYIDEELNLEDLTLTNLMQALSNFLERKELEQPLNTKITSKEYSVHKRSEEIRKIINQKRKITFHDLFTSFQKDYIIVTFLAILELAKKQEIKLEQSNNFKEIYLLAKE